MWQYCQTGAPNHIKGTKRSQTQAQECGQALAADGTPCKRCPRPGHGTCNPPGMAVYQHLEHSPCCSSCGSLWQHVAWAALHQLPQGAAAAPVHHHVQAVHVLIHGTQRNHMRLSNYSLQKTTATISTWPAEILTAYKRQLPATLITPPQQLKQALVSTFVLTQQWVPLRCCMQVLVST